MHKGINWRFFNVLLGRSAGAKPQPATGAPGRFGYRWGRQQADGEKPLSHCHEGDNIFIRRVAGGGPIHRRLLEMGLIPGTPIRVIKYAPLKDPLECEVKGYHVALRVAEAQMIIVAPASP
ncbi:MAG TPA: FeoA family protein [bacterium]